MRRIDKSVVIPFLNEQDSLKKLFDELIRILSTLEKSYENIFIDDGSTDHSAEIAKEISVAHRTTRLIKLRGNQGKTAAWTVGFDLSSSEIVLTLDADLQDDPMEIQHFIEAIGG